MLAPGETYMLGAPDVDDLIRSTPDGIVRFVQELSQEMAAVYGDRRLESIDRFGWTEGYRTLEWMECRGPDYTVGKLIGSAPEASTTVNGTMILHERDRAEEVLICDAGKLTSIRTATTTALVINTLRPYLETMSVIGAGAEGQEHAFVMALLAPNLHEIRVADIQSERAEATAEMFAEAEDALRKIRGAELTVAVMDPEDPRITDATDAIVTATLGQEVVLGSADLQNGVVVAAVGADMIGKRELDDEVYAKANFVADDLRQCLREGELQHAASVLGLNKRERGMGTYYGSLLGGRIIGITDLLRSPQVFKDRPETVTIYDSTGFSGQDLAVGRVMMRMLEARSWPSTRFHPPESTRHSFARLMGIDVD